MKTQITIKIDESLKNLLLDEAVKEGCSVSDLASLYLRRSLQDAQFRSVRQKLIPYAEALGFTDEKAIFEEIS